MIFLCFFLGHWSNTKKIYIQEPGPNSSTFHESWAGPICLEVSSSNQSRLHIPLCSTGPAGVGSGCSDSGWPARLFHAQYRCMHRMHLRIRWTSQIQFLKTKKGTCTLYPEGFHPSQTRGNCYQLCKSPHRWIQRTVFACEKESKTARCPLVVLVIMHPPALSGLVAISSIK